MNGKIFSATALVALAGLAGVALGTRPAVNPAADNAAAAPNVETFVIQRTEHVRKRIKRKKTSTNSGVRVSAENAAPPVRTSPSSTGGEEAEHEHDHEFEDSDHDVEQDD